MVDFERARTQMVESQLRSGGVTNPAILARMRTVPREDFVPAIRRELAYIDDIHWLGDKASGRFMAAPATLARLLALAEITETDAVLDVGAATGYSTAVLAGIAASVTGLEADAALAASARDNLVALGAANASIVHGDIGHIGKARFDVIVVEGALDAVPDAFIGALAEGGRLVTLMRNGAVGLAHLFVRSGKEVTARAAFNAVLPPLFAERPDREFVF